MTMSALLLGISRVLAFDPDEVLLYLLLTKGFLNLERMPSSNSITEDGMNDTDVSTH
jgi:hypothetical protein